jgi:hypothetical protein
LLADQELIGFARRGDSDDQAVQRAGSAKVTTKPNQRREPEKASTPPHRDGN